MTVDTDALGDEKESFSLYFSHFHEKLPVRFEQL